MTTTQPAPITHQSMTGTVKKVISGDCCMMVNAKGTLEMQVMLSNVIAPKVANITKDGASKEEPFGWEAREYLRNAVLGREVTLEVEFKLPSGSPIGIMWIGRVAGEGRNVAAEMIEKGLLTVKESRAKGVPSEIYQQYVELQNKAKANGVGKWAEDAAKHVRQIKLNPSDPQALVDSYKQKPIKAIVENVLPSGIRIYLPDFHYITVMFLGLRQSTDDEEKKRAQKICEKILQQEVQVILYAANNNGTFLGVVRHPTWDVPTRLVQEGLATFAEFGRAPLPADYAKKLRDAEAAAKQAKIGMWRNYVVSEPRPGSRDQYEAKVLEIVNPDCLMVKKAGGVVAKIFLSSIRLPRKEGQDASGAPPRGTGGKASHRLFETPYLFEIREYLRTKLIGKTVLVQVDYIQEKSENYPEKTCATITIGGVNIAEDLLSRGYASIIRHKQDSNDRSRVYATLQEAEAAAIKGFRGIHAKKEPEPMRVVDLQGDLQKSKQFHSLLQRAGRMSAIVEFVTSGSRLRVFIAKQNCLTPLLLAGISCVRGRRFDREGKIIGEGDPFGDEATDFVRDAVMQRDVQIEIDGIDRIGNLIGWVHHDGVNLSVELVKQGYASVHYSAESSSYYKQLSSAEDFAKGKRLRIWKDYDEKAEQLKQQEKAAKTTDLVDDTDTERKVQYKRCMLSDVKPSLTSFYVHLMEDGPKLEQLMSDLRKELESPALASSYTPQRGGLCAAKFVDGLWYRARIDSMSQGKIQVTYIDYGNSEETDVTRLTALPGRFSSVPAFAKEYHLAFVKPPTDEDDLSEAVMQFTRLVENKELRVNTEYTLQKEQYATVVVPAAKSDAGGSEDKKEDLDVGFELVSTGYVYAERRREKRLEKLNATYQKAQEDALKARQNIWRYGDNREDDDGGFKL